MCQLHVWFARTGFRARPSLKLIAEPLIEQILANVKNKMELINQIQLLKSDLQDTIARIVSYVKYYM